MSTSITTTSRTEVEVTTCEVCQEAADLEPWPCCGEVTACAECCDYSQTCQTCQRWEDRGASIAVW